MSTPADTSKAAATAAAASTASTATANNRSPPNRSPRRSPRDNIPEEMLKKWEATQLELVGKADISDTRLGFDPTKFLGDLSAAPGATTSKSSAVGATSAAAAPASVLPSAPPATVGLAAQAQAQAAAAATSSNNNSALPPLRWIGGLDISFVKDTSIAVASLVVLDGEAKKEPFPVVYEDMLHCTMAVPYVPGFLAFREVEPLRELIRRIKANAPQFFPQIFFIDGNGALHHRKCGQATHFGVLEDVPIVGVAKNLLAVDGLQREAVEAQVAAAAAKKIPPLPHVEPDTGAFSYRGVTLSPLKGQSGFVYGFACLSGNSTSKPIYISPGHRVSLRTAALLAVRLASFRVVEPIRQADLRSRQYITKNLAIGGGGSGDDE